MKRDNFYIYFSVASLLFIAVLIYYFYKMKFNLDLNINTILTVIGTVIGAYFGAKIAGKYAVDSVREQITDNNNKIEKAKHETFLKIYLVVKPTFFYFASTLSKTLNDIHHKNNNTNYIKKSELIRETMKIINKVKQFSSEYDEYNLHELAFEYYKEIVSGEKIITTSLYHLDELRRLIINSEDGVVLPNTSLEYLRTNLEHLEGIIERLESYEALSYERIV